jgi:hypothetical protein
MKTFSGFLADGSELTEHRETFLYRLFRGYARIFEQYPGRFGETIQTQLAAFAPYVKPMGASSGGVRSARSPSLAACGATMIRAQKTCNRYSNPAKLLKHCDPVIAREDDGDPDESTR